MMRALPQATLLACLICAPAVAQAAPDGALRRACATTPNKTPSPTSVGLIALTGSKRTQAARDLARRFGLKLRRVPLDRYIGETEKNIEGLFAAAASEGVVLFFDEADALFGKRTEVQDAHDRYANQNTSALSRRLKKGTRLVLLGLRRGAARGRGPTLAAQLSADDKKPVWTRLCRRFARR
jgi:hypothetical protein